jgi:hypothetical protein
MNDIHVYSIQTYENQISHDYYCQIATHEICDACTWFVGKLKWKKTNNNIWLNHSLSSYPMEMTQLLVLEFKFGRAKFQRPDSFYMWD